MPHGFRQALISVRFEKRQTYSLSAWLAAWFCNFHTSLTSEFVGAVASGRSPPSGKAMAALCRSSNGKVWRACSGMLMTPDGLALNMEWSWLVICAACLGAAALLLASWMQQGPERHPSMILGPTHAEPTGFPLHYSSKLAKLPSGAGNRLTTPAS